MKLTRTKLIALVTVAVASGGFALSSAIAPLDSASDQASVREAADTCTVSKVVDGDTLYVDCLPKSIRLIGVDTPETVKPNTAVQCFGTDASNYTKQLLDQQVYLEADPSQGDTDAYQRYLRYIFTTSGVNWNLQLISEGYAHEYTYKKAYKYQAEFKAAEISAKDQQKGLWGASCS